MWGGPIWGRAIAGLVTVAAVAGPAVAGTVHAKGHRPAAKVGPRGPRGRRGATGPTGPAGIPGPSGPPGASFLRTVVVSPSGASPAVDGALLAAAVALIPQASASSPWLVWLEPGVYDLGTAALSLPPHVDLEGSGQDVTTISGEGPRLLEAGNASEIRSLSVADVAGGASALAIDTQGGLHDVSVSATAPTAATAVLDDAPAAPLLDVTALATTTDVASVAVAIDARDGTARLDGGSYTATDNVASGEAVALLAESGANLNDVTLAASGGNAAFPADLVGTGVLVTVQDSTLAGSGGLAVAAGDTLDVGGSQVPGIVTNVFGTAHCPDDWLADYATSDAVCG